MEGERANIKLNQGLYNDNDTSNSAEQFGSSPCDEGDSGRQRSLLVIVGTAAGVIVLSAVLHQLSFLLFMLWNGVLGVIITRKLVRWEIGLDSSFLNGNQIGEDVQCAMDNKGINKEVGEQVKDTCSVCGRLSCNCHGHTSSVKSLQPWVGLTIPKKVDDALEEFLTHVLDRFVYNWYRKLSADDAVIDELRAALRFLVAQLLLRLKKVNLTEFVTKEIIPAIATHLVQHVHSHRKVGRCNPDRIRLRRNRVHRSLFTRDDELDYLKQLTRSLFPYILPKNVQLCRSLMLLLEQLLAGVVLLPTLDKLADPDFINNLLILLVDEEPPPLNPDPPTELVEILAHFSQPNSTTQSFHCQDLGKILADETLLQAFTDVMKENGGLKFLQLFITLEDFKRAIMADGDMRHLEDEALHMYRVFCRPDAADFIDLGPELLDQFRQLAERGSAGIRELRNDEEFIARAYDYLYNLMENYYLPIFKHSQQYFTFLYGEKHARPESSQCASKQDRRGFRLSSMLRSSLKGERGGSSLSGSNNNLRDMENSSPSSTPDCMSLQDEDIADETLTDDLHDMSKWEVDLPSVSIQQDSRSKPSYFFQVKVCKNDPNMTLSETEVDLQIRTGSSVYRTYNEFYTLEQKLKHFHGAKLNSQLPPKKIFAIKDHEYLDVVKPKFEAFLKVELFLLEKYQRYFSIVLAVFIREIPKYVLGVPDLKSSELLYSFLTVSNFTRSSIADLRIENVLKSVPGKLIKERGQNLKGFLKSFQHSTIPKPPRPDFSKVAELSAETEDRHQPLIVRHLHNRLYEKSHIRQLSNGVAVEPNNHLLSDTSAKTPANTVKLSSVVDCVLRIAEEVFSIPKTLHWILTTVMLIGKDWLDALILWYIRGKLEQVLEEHRVKSLIKLLQDNIFYGDGLLRTEDQRAERKLKALRDVKSFIPPAVHKIVGEKSSETALEEMFAVLQHPKLNKQLIYILLDTVVCELFPELNS